MSRNVKPDEQFARLLELSAPGAVVTEPAMSSMTALAGALRAAGSTAAPTGPDPAFRAALRQRLVAVATVQANEPATARTIARPTFGYRAHRRLAAMAGTIAIVTSVAGVGVAAARSLPGDPFYGVKRTTEAVQLWTARGDVAKGKRHLEFARTRLAEARKLPANSSHLASTLTAMNAQISAGSSELISAYNSSKSTAPLADLTMFTQQQYAGLVQLATTVPAVVRQQEVQSIVLLIGVVKQVQAIAPNHCLVCLPTGRTPTPSTIVPTKPPVSTPTSAATNGRHPGTHSGKSHGHGSKPVTTPTSHPNPTPTSILPTVLPLPIISSLLHPHGTKHPKPLLTPIPIVTKLLGGLGL